MLFNDNFLETNEYKVNWTNSNKLKLDGDNKGNLYCDNDGEDRNYCHFFDKVEVDIITTIWNHKS